MKRSHQDDEETIAFGYVNSYTPPKQGTNHFFFDFQTICFDNTKSTIIQDYLHSGSPVKLRNIVFQDTDSKYLAQVKLNARTIITTANNCQVEFNQKKSITTDNAPVIRVRDIQNFNDGDLVTIQALVSLSPNEPKTQKCCNGQYRLMPDNNILSDDTGSASLTLWSDNIDFIRENIEKGHKYFLLKGIRVRTFLSTRKSITTIASSQIKVLDNCPPELSGVEPTIPSTDTLETIHVKQFMLVSSYTEYASCLNCKCKISDVSVQDLKCPTCNTSQRLSNCEKKIIVKVKLAVDSPWLTLFKHVWENILPNVNGSDNVTNALLNQLKDMTIVVGTSTCIIKEIRLNEPEGNFPNAEEEKLDKAEKAATDNDDPRIIDAEKPGSPPSYKEHGKKGKNAKK